MTFYMTVLSPAKYKRHRLLWWPIILYRNLWHPKLNIKMITIDRKIYVCLHFFNVVIILSLDQNPKLAVPLYQFKKQLANFTHKMTSCRLLKGPFISLHRRGGVLLASLLIIFAKQKKYGIFRSH